MTQNAGPPAGPDPTVPNVARIYDYMLGGKDHYAVDRAAAKILEQIPHSQQACQQNRAFLGRVVAYLAGSPRHHPVPRHRLRAAHPRQRPPDRPAPQPPRRHRLRGLRPRRRRPRPRTDRQGNTRRHRRPSRHPRHRRRLGFAYAPGRHARFEPGSPDLPAVTRAIDRITATPLPPVAAGWRETRYDRYAPATAGRFAGDTLLHGDINPDNLLISPDGTATVVDWSWPTHGAAFIDPACLAVQLIAAGHTPAHAEQWAAQCTAWHHADPAAITAFAAATLRMYQRFEEHDPQPWRKAMTTAAAQWAEHRATGHTRAEP